MVSRENTQRYVIVAYIGLISLVFAIVLTLANIILAGLGKLTIAQMVGIDSRIVPAASLLIGGFCIAWSSVMYARSEGEVEK